MYKDPQELLIVLNNTLRRKNIEMTLGFIIGMLESSDVYITEDMIKNYMEIKKKDNVKEKDINEMNYGERFIYKFNLDKYEYEPYMMYYYKKTINLLKRKCFKFIKLIESIVNKDAKEEDLINYDISIDKDGNILSTDIQRIIKPFVYNLYLLINKTIEANELDSYINHKINLNNLLRDGITEEDLYPSEELQSDSFGLYKDENAYIPYTDKQRIIKENMESDQFGRSIHYVEDMLKNERVR